MKVLLNKIDYIDDCMKSVWTENSTGGPEWNESELNQREMQKWDNIKLIFDRLQDPEFRVKIIENDLDSANRMALFPSNLNYSEEEYKQIKEMCKRLDLKENESLV